MYKKNKTRKANHVVKRKWQKKNKKISFFHMIQKADKSIDLIPQ